MYENIDISLEIVKKYETFGRNTTEGKRRTEKMRNEYVISVRKKFLSKVNVFVCVTYYVYNTCGYY
jgi:hypothetical protein